MKRDLAKFPKLNSSFLSCQKDTETILRKLFVESRPYSDILKRLLVISTKDCIDDWDNEEYIKRTKETTVKTLWEDKYIRLEPTIWIPEHQEIKTYIILSYDNFIPNARNPQFRDCTVSFDIICHAESWDIGDYKLRPLAISGYIDGILNGTKLSGIGTFQFASCEQLILSEDMSGYTLSYRAIHGTDDQLPVC